MPYIFQSGPIAAPPVAAVSEEATFSPNRPHYQTGYVQPGTYTNSANHARLAMLSSVIFNHWPSNGSGLADSLPDIQALHPAQVGVTPVHTVYLVNNEVNKTDAEFADLRTKLAAETWYAYASGTTTIVDADFGGGTHYGINNTDQKLVNGSGDYWMAWHMRRYYELCVTGGTFPSGTTPACPDLHGLHWDNCFFRNRIDFDIDRDGDNDPRADAYHEQAYRNGMKQTFAYARSYWPTARYFLGNIADLFQEFGDMNTEAFTYDVADLTPYDEKFIDGGLAGEPINGRHDAYGDIQGFYSARNIMRVHDACVAEPCLNWWLVDCTTTADNSTNWRKIRYWNAFLLICSEGGIDLNQDFLDWTNLPDDFVGGSASGREGVGFLGQPLEGPQYTPWIVQGTHGIYRRRFEHGWAILNPLGNTSETVSLGQSMKLLAGRSGRSDTSVYTGSTVTSVSLADEDAVILLFP